MPSIVVAESTGHSMVDKDLFYPEGKKLLFSMYSLADPYLARAMMDGLTAVGPYYGKYSQRKAISSSQKSELPVIYPAGSRFDFELRTELTLEGELDQLRHEITIVSQRPEIAAWALATEELRYWRAIEMEWLEKATEVIRKSDPYNRPIMMYEPNHRGADALLKTTKFLDFVAKGTYANYVGMKYKRTWVRWSIEESVAVSRVTETTPLAVLWMARDQVTEADVSSIELWTRHDVYLSLVSGAKGILIYSGWNHRAGFLNHFNKFYEGYIATAKELNGDLNLGQVFLHGDKRDLISVSVIDGPSTQSFTKKNEIHEYPTVTKAEYFFCGKKYLFLVNSAESSVVIKLSGLALENTDYFNSFNGEKTALTDLDGTLKLDRLEVLGFVWQ